MNGIECIGILIFLPDYEGLILYLSFMILYWIRNPNWYLQDLCTFTFKVLAEYKSKKPIWFYLGFENRFYSLLKQLTFHLVIVFFLILSMTSFFVVQHFERSFEHWNIFKI